MASIQHYLSDSQIVWESFDFSACNEFSVSEVWVDKEYATTTTVLHRKVANPQAKEWLHQTDGSNSWLVGQENQRCALRIVWIHHDTKRRLDNIDQGIFQELCRTFDHELAQSFLRTQYAGIGTIDSTTLGETHFLCNHPKLAVTWSQDAKSKVVSVICTADRFKLDTLQGLMGCQFTHELAQWNILPALMCSILSSKEVDIEAGDVKRVVRQIEVRTGYHEWTSRSEGPARGDLVSLSARITGSGSRIASNTRKLGVIADYCRFIRMRVCKGEVGAGPSGIEAILGAVEHRTAMQTLDLKYIQHRVQSQKEALFNLVSANDSVVARDISENSRMLASATNSDARSMKVLAMLTMTFLPGTFVAGIFSTPIVQRPLQDDLMSLKIWKVGLLLYITLSFALVLLVFATWGLWNIKEKTKKVRTQNTAYSLLQNSTETGALALKRAAVLDSKTSVPLPACQI
ncbi:hypothetical protein P171DRAFT_476680 [Karstenula rhodostoma CBS 690.94]|uniref:Uncharacterized protein n=1 Tax=Karstenula rhodostoma CBS 690.94 TaxID=1392251 RepID=A0A9P4PAM2_9PLEO|nr:hypothetical protein P171DRAFT_476680 [Karstenula rhodostoma CBS 690.94]